jgi:hypothetical protein
MTPQASSKTTESTQLSEMPSSDLRTLPTAAPESGAEQAGEPAASVGKQDEVNRDPRYRIISLATYQIYSPWE